MTSTFEITPDREFLQHFLTRWRTKSLLPEMVDKLKKNSKTDPYAAYGYGRWLSLVNPGGNCLEEAEELLTWAGSNGVQDANAALSELFFDGRIKEDKANPEMHAYLMESSYKQGSELAQYLALESTLYGDYGYKKDAWTVADILQKHLEKNPGSDPIYYDLLGRALEDTDPEAAEKAFRTSLARGNTESYYSLASLYERTGDEAKAWEIAEEGARNGAVNCHRFKAGMNKEDFEKLPVPEQESLHREIARGLDYAIAHHDSYACYLKGVLLYLGYLGFPQDDDAASEPVERGCEMGVGACWLIKAAILENKEMKGVEDASLRALRMGSREDAPLEQVARGYVSGVLSRHADEIEKLWLREYVQANPEEEDGKDALGVVAVYPQGFYYAMDVDDPGELDLEWVAEKVDACGFDVVHFSPVLTRMTKALGLEETGCHVAMLVDKDGYMKDLPDNMAGTLIYGQGQEIRGTVVFVLEDDKKYTLMPMQGLQRMYMFIQLLNAASGGLVRLPSSEELASIGAEDRVITDSSVSTEPKELTVSADQVLEGIAACNLCIDTLHVVLPADKEYWFLSTEDLFFKLDIKDAIEENIEQHGGYMIDAWQYVDARQVPMDIRSRVRFKQA